MNRAIESMLVRDEYEGPPSTTGCRTENPGDALSDAFRHNGALLHTHCYTTGNDSLHRLAEQV